LKQEEDGYKSPGHQAHFRNAEEEETPPREEAWSNLSGRQAHFPEVEKAVGTVEGGTVRSSAGLGIAGLGESRVRREEDRRPVVGMGFEQAGREREYPEDTAVVEERIDLE
jgi:hypothetical protein